MDFKKVLLMDKDQIDDDYDQGQIMGSRNSQQRNIVLKRLLRKRYTSSIRQSWEKWYDETYLVRFDEFRTPNGLIDRYDYFKNSLNEKNEDLNDLNEQNNYLQVTMYETKHTKIELMKILEAKEKLSLNLSEKTDQVTNLTKENERLISEILCCRNSAKELISHGVSYIHSIQEDTDNL